MSPTRRQVVNAIAAGAFVPGTVATAAAQDDDDQDFSPDVTISPNNLVATIGDRDGDVDPDTVTVYTADGGEHEFDGTAPDEWQAGEAFDVGYTHDESRARIDGWHGVIDGVTARKDGETVSATNDAESTLEVTCSLWRTPDQPPTEFEVLSEGARKQHFDRGDDDLSEDRRQYGSPGRALQTVAERNPEIAMRVDFDGCTPETEKALRFDCTSVTVEPDELNQGEDRIEDVQLGFADGTFESPSGTADDADDGAYELPVTLSGSGDNEGKVVERLEFRVPGGEYTYWNLEAEQCSERQDAGSGDDADGLPDTDSDEPTETPTPDGSNSENVSVNATDDAAGANGTGTANGSGSSGDEPTGGENGSANGSSDPGIATGTPAEDQPGLGFAAGLGGLLGVGELARRKIGVDDEE